MLFVLLAVKLCMGIIFIIHYVRDENEMLSATFEKYSNSVCREIDSYVWRMYYTSPLWREHWSRKGLTQYFIPHQSSFIFTSHSIPSRSIRNNGSPSPGLTCQTPDHFCFYHPHFVRFSITRIIICTFSPFLVRISSTSIRFYDVKVLSIQICLFFIKVIQFESDLSGNWKEWDFQRKI